jgi:hypothetical protein
MVNQSGSASKATRSWDMFMYLKKTAGPSPAFAKFYNA